MANGGILIPPSEDTQHARLWDETQKRLERFLPGMFGEIFPEPAAVVPSVMKDTTLHTEGIGVDTKRGASKEKTQT